MEQQDNAVDAILEPAPVKRRTRGVGLEGAEADDAARKFVDEVRLAGTSEDAASYVLALLLSGAEHLSRQFQRIADALEQLSQALKDYNAASEPLTLLQAVELAEPEQPEATEAPPEKPPAIAQKPPARKPASKSKARRKR